jgi:hypothetical protein
MAPTGPGPVLGDPDPTTGRVIAFGPAIPGELQDDPTVFITEDLFARRPHHIRHLRALYDRFGPSVDRFDFVVAKTG